MLFCVFGGFLTLFSIKIEVFPEFSLDKVNVEVTYLGASPAEVEEAVVRRIEERVAGVEGVRRIDSAAREGFGAITVEAVQGWDVQKLLDDVKSEVDRITTLPDEAEKPVVKELTQRTQVMWLAVYGEASEHTIKHLTEKVKDEVTTLPGVTVAELFGVRRGEIVLEVSEDTLRRHNLTLGAVADKVRQGSLDLPAGSLKTAGSEVLVRSKGRRYHAAEYGDITVLSNPDGSRVSLDQLAELTEGFEDIDLAARFQGQPAGLVQIYRVADQNALGMAEELQQYGSTSASSPTAL
jgi:multidrug efflux pump subunit AcrB